MSEPAELSSLLDHLNDLLPPEQSKLPKAIIPTRPDTELLRILHRGEESYIHLAAKTPAGWKQLGNARDLTGLFRQQTLDEIGEHDLYASINGFHASENCRGPKARLPGLAKPLSKEQSVRWLNALYVDLDCYKSGISKWQAMAAVMERADANQLPYPSAFSFSQGCWALWLVRDRANKDQPVRVYPPEQIGGWFKSLQRELIGRCQGLEPDPKVTDLGRVFRIPGSISSVNQQRVGWMLCGDRFGGKIIYTLEELDNILRPSKAVRKSRPSQTCREFVDDAVRARKRAGSIGRYQTLVYRLEELRHMRRGWKVGHRDSVLFHLATALRLGRFTKAETERIFKEHLRDMEQPAGDRKTLGDCWQKYANVEKAKGGRQHHENQTIADNLGVSRAEAIELSIGRRYDFPPARLHAKPEPTEKREKPAETRRKLIQAIWDRQGPMSGAGMEKALRESGLSAARATVISDLRALGLYREKPAVSDPQRSLQLT